MTEQTTIPAESAEDAQASLLTERQLGEEATPLDLCDLHGVKPEWHPADEAGVNWVVGEINACTDRITGLTAEYEAAAARLKRNYESQIKTAEGRRDFLQTRYEGDLKAFAFAQIAKAKGKSKTVTLSSGRLSFRTTPARVKLDADTSRLVRWARDTGHDSFVKTTVTETVNRAEMAKELVIQAKGVNEHGEVEYAVVHRSTGEEVPVAEIVPEQEGFEVK